MARVTKSSTVKIALVISTKFRYTQHWVYVAKREHNFLDVGGSTACTYCLHCYIHDMIVRVIVLPTKMIILKGTSD